MIFFTNSCYEAISLAFLHEYHNWRWKTHTVQLVLLRYDSLSVIVRHKILRDLRPRKGWRSSYCQAAADQVDHTCIKSSSKLPFFKRENMEDLSAPFWRLWAGKLWGISTVTEQENQSPFLVMLSLHTIFLLNFKSSFFIESKI